MVLASPVIFSQIWRFIAPGLYHHEKRVLVPFTVVSTLCFVGGTAFGYFIVFPPAFEFLLGYSSAFLEPLPSVDEYFSLALRLFLAFGCIFELPVFMVFSAQVGLASAATFARFRRYAILIIAIVAAVLTPTPDLVNMALMGGPLYLLYESGILLIRLLPRLNAPAAGESDSNDAEAVSPQQGGGDSGQGGKAAGGAA